MKRFHDVIFWLIVVSLPFFLGFTTIQLATTQTFLRWEYAKPNFPPDRFGFTQAQRLKLAAPAIEFLQVLEAPKSAIRLLEEQTFEGKPIYNQRELDHMIDTKVRTDFLRSISWITGIIVIAGTIYLASQKQSNGPRRAWNALFNGAVLTTLILGAISLYILVGWESFFIRFHELLFPPGTWTFSYSETLIRLFPEKFWFDVGVLIGVGTLVEAIVIGAVAFWMGRREIALLRSQ
jgi:integral membrane protein (TIGR01906 family)